MPRTRTNVELRSREARRRLRARREPYWHRVETGLFLGYRRSASAGAWIARRYDPAAVRYVESALAMADDYRDADGAEVLDFGQAQRRLLTEAHEKAMQASGQRYTVADAVRDYLAYQREHRKSADRTAIALTAYVLPQLGEKRIVDLKPADFDSWLQWALRRRRKRAPAEHTVQEPIERQRRRKATLNRVINALKACLNHAAEAGKVPSRDAWERLRKYRSADAARLRWLTLDEAQRLQNAAGADFRPLVAAALVAGCRLGELLALEGGDFDSRSRTLLIADSKSGRPRRVPLTPEGEMLFEELTAGKTEDERLFCRADGTRWSRMAVVRAMREACTGGKVRPAATFHTLRHTYASHLVQAGTPLLYVASVLGHSDTRMVEKHYGHLAPSAVADAIRAALPAWGVAPVQSNVEPLRTRSRRA